ncbi:hypothetical protein D3C80_832260 [compost metagenome]
MIARLQRLLVPEQGEVVQNCVVLAEDHVVRQARARQGDRRVVRPPPIRRDHAVIHVGRVLGVVEEQQLAGPFIHPRMGRHPVQRRPGRDAFIFQGVGVQLIGLAALVEGRQRLARMDHHIGAGRILDAAVSAEAGTLRHVRPVHHPAPQALARLLFGLEAAPPNKAVAIVRLAIPKADLMQHSVAVERMMAAQGRVHLVLGIAEIDAVDVRRDRALDHLQIEGVHLLMLGRPRPAQIGVVAGLEGRDDGRQTLDLHGSSPGSGRTLALLVYLRKLQARIFSIRSHRPLRPSIRHAPTSRFRRRRSDPPRP